MRAKTPGYIERLQYDTDGQVVGKLVKTVFGQCVFLLQSGFVLIQHESTRRLGVWDCNRRKVVKFAPKVVEVEIDAEL